MSTDGFVPDAQGATPPPPRRPPGDPQWSSAAPGTPAPAQVPAQAPAPWADTGQPAGAGTRAFAGPGPYAAPAAGTAPTPYAGQPGGTVPQVPAQPVPAQPASGPAGGSNSPWGAARRPTEERVTNRVRRIVEGLPDWEPLPPGETVVRRPGGTG